MSKKTIIAALLVAMSAIPMTAQQTTAITGSWITDDGETRIEIFERGGRFYGKIAALKYPFYEKGEEKGMDGRPRVDLKNPDRSLRTRPLSGLEIFYGFSESGGKYTGGKIYDPDEGKTYDCELWVDGSGDLNVRGFIGISALGRTEKFRSLTNHCKKEMRFLGLPESACEK